MSKYLTPSWFTVYNNYSKQRHKLLLAACLARWYLEQCAFTNYLLQAWINTILSKRKRTFRITWNLSVVVQATL